MQRLSAALASTLVSKEPAHSVDFNVDIANSTDGIHITHLLVAAHPKAPA